MRASRFACVISLKATRVIVPLAFLLAMGCASSELDRDVASNLLSNQQETRGIILPKDEPSDSDLLTLTLAKHGLLTSGSSGMDLSSDGRRYAADHNWAHKFDSLIHQTYWEIPYADVSVTEVTGIAMDDETHATADYTFVVKPNEIGSMMLEERPNAPDDATAGWTLILEQWNRTQQGKASFRHYDDGWRVETP